MKKLCLRAERYPDAFRGLKRITVDNDPMQIKKFDRKHKPFWSPTNKFSKHSISFAKGTVGYGYMSGGYESEWEDNPAYLILVDHYIDEHTNYPEHGSPKYFGKNKITPSVIFKHFNI